MRDSTTTSCDATAIRLPSLDQLGTFGARRGDEHVDRVSHELVEQSILGWADFVGRPGQRARNLARLASRYAAPADDLARLITAYVTRSAKRCAARSTQRPSPTWCRVGSRRQAAAASNPPTVLAGRDQRLDQPAPRRRPDRQLSGRRHGASAQRHG